MQPVHNLIRVTLPAYFESMPIPDSLGGWFSLGAGDWMRLLPFGVAVTGLSYLTLKGLTITPGIGPSLEVRRFIRCQLFGIPLRFKLFWLTNWLAGPRYLCSVCRLHFGLEFKLSKTSLGFIASSPVRDAKNENHLPITGNVFPLFLNCRVRVVTLWSFIFQKSLSKVPGFQPHRVNTEIKMDSAKVVDTVDIEDMGDKVR